MTANRPPENLKLTMREAAVSVVRRLQGAGHDALFAGGCVRDMLMGKRPHDFDVATSAKPREVIGLFRRTQKVGAKFGVVLVRVGPFAIEVATFRSDADYEDGRHPTQVQFTDARQDAERRDFTINGMFYDPIQRKTVDYVRGRVDLAAHVIRAIGDPERRFAEDHLRILRAIRFAARLGFTIEPATWSAMTAQAQQITRISPERIRDELEQMLAHPSRARAFADLHASGVLRHLWPGAEVIDAQAAKITAILEALLPKATFDTAWAVVLHTLPPEGVLRGVQNKGSAGPPRPTWSEEKPPTAARKTPAPCTVESVCDAMRCSNRTKATASWLIAHQDDLADSARLRRMTLADLKLLMAHPAFPQLLAVFAARLRAEGRPLSPYRQILARARAIPSDEVAPPPLLDGRALAKLGLPPGPPYKIILFKTYYAQLNGDLATREAALAYARQLLRELQPNK